MITYYWFDGVLYTANGQRLGRCSWTNAMTSLQRREQPFTLLRQMPPV